MYLLEHEVLIAFFLGCICIPCHMENITFHFPAVFIVYDYIILCQDHGFIVLYKVHFFDIFKKCRYIRCYEVAAFAYACNKRRILSHCNDLVRFCRSYGTYSICSPHLTYSSVDCCQQIALIIHSY